MSDQFKQMLMLLFGSALILVLTAWLFDDWLHARRFVEFDVEKQGTILELDQVTGGKSPR